jgi:ATP-dependent Lhr-like helicase
MTEVAFHPTVARWFADRVGEPTAPQREGWPAIAGGGHVLIAAPTGTGKTLAAFLWALDGLLRQGEALADATTVLYVSPLRALSNDVRVNLSKPLAELRDLDPSLPEVRVLVRTGDTTAAERAKMLRVRNRPHVLVTTPESLYILLTSAGGRRMLGDVRTVIVDEIHAMARDKRGSHLALSLERLEHLTGGVQRIGLSATQKPLATVGRLLVGQGRRCTLVDTGHLRELDLAVEVPEDPLGAVCSHEHWGSLYARMSALIEEHKTTLVFVGTRKLAERLAARLTEALGEERIACHHGSLSKELRHDAEQRLKRGELSALVATASLELGIDIGDVDLVIQVGSARSIATALQRVGRAGHGVNRVPKGRLFPLTLDELAEAGALLSALRRSELDRTPEPPPAVDILLQQAVASCVADEWDQDELFAMLQRAWPYRAVTREAFDAAVALHTEGRYALLHKDGVNGRLLATKRARIPALTSGGAIPDTADYEVRLEPEGILVGTLNEDFAIEANMGDIFQLGNTSWRILKVEPGKVRVADAQGEPPTLPFWLGEAPARTRELSAEIGTQRERPPTQHELEAWGLSREAAEQLSDYQRSAERDLGVAPTQRQLVAERFFDETGGMQLVIHSPFGGRINRAFGLALRKKFCRGFGFELQAAASEEAILLSLGPQHSFPLESVFNFLHPKTARETLVQALLAAPMFTTRWRWNVTRSLMLPRMRGGKRVPPALQRMRADDLLTAAFPQVMACGETLPPGDLPVPMDHPVVAQTIEDCLTEAMDIDGLVELLEGIASGAIATHAVDRPEPSALAAGILSAQPYAFLDDAPLEERRTQAVARRRGLTPEAADELGALDPAAVDRVRGEAWPEPASAEELHECLLWMGYLHVDEVGHWQPWLDALASAGRVERDGERWFATEAPRDELSLWRGRLEALGPVFSEEPALLELEASGEVLRTRIDGRQAFCNRRLLARIHAYTLRKLRAEIEPVSAAVLLRSLVAWQHVDAGTKLEGPGGVMTVVEQLAGFEASAVEWERSILPARVQGYRPGWLDELCLSGRVAWGRLWGAGASAVRATPLALVPRDELDGWLGLAGPGDAWSLSGSGKVVHDVLQTKGACFPQELLRASGLLPAQAAEGLSQLVSLGLASCDGFGGLRELLSTRKHRRSRRPAPHAAIGRWSLLGRESCETPDAFFIARALLRRYGVVFRRLLERERVLSGWRPVLLALRTLEARGEVRGGRFVAGFAGEQYALPGAVELLRRTRRDEDADRAPVMVSAADPLNLRGIVTPDERVASNARRRVAVA